MRVKNESNIKKNIKNILGEFNSALNELDQVKNETKKCRQLIGDSESELLKLSRSIGNSVLIENIGSALRSADEITARKNELTSIISINQKRIETLNAGNSNLLMKSNGYKEPLQSARSEYCRAYEEALKKTSEWKKVNDQLNVLKALWLETFNGNIFVEDIVSEMGLHEIPAEYLKELARVELSIK